MLCLQAITRFDIAKKFSAGEQLSYTQLAESTGLNEQLLRRLLRHAMTMRVFSEPSKDFVAHTAASMLLTEPHMHDWMRTGCEEMWPAATRVMDAVEKWPASQEANETGFALANDTGSSIYQVVGSDPLRAARFANAMKAYTSSRGFEVSHIIDNYNWDGVGNGLVVDIGGGRGHVAIPLAQRYQSLHVVVQDMPQVVEGAASDLPAQLAIRVKFMAHDFFAEQPVEADVYYFRWIFHNWSDKYSVQILRYLRPALRHGARVVIQDTCLPEPGKIAQWREKELRAADLNMLGAFNSRERDLEEWKHLFQEADSRFDFIGVEEPRGSALAIIEARWNDPPASS
ncbi:MAG: hypothetical protein ASARMPREDX12_006780 [Alectoria sarmentosa]|nr:MAG: hypothetical protein ASARMPREDX12_006780 [Alectoria sarmentosa]